MTAILVSVAEAIREELASVSLSEAFTLIRSYADWEAELDDFDVRMRLDVVPVECQTVMITRAKHEYQCVVSVLLRKRLADADRLTASGRIDNDVIDRLIEDLQTVAEYFSPSQPTLTGRKLTSVPEARWLEESTAGGDGGDGAKRRSGITAPFSRRMLSSHNQYSGWITLVYGVPRGHG